MERIIVIDQNEKSRNSVCNSLRNAGYHVTSLEYWEEENEQLYKRIKIDFILINNSIFLSKYNIENLRNKLNCPIMVILEGECEESIFKGLACEADDIILKPIREKELLTKVKFYCNSRKKHVENISGVSFIDAETSICIDEAKIKLTKKEYLLCKMMAKNSSSIISKENLYEIIYDFDTNTQLRTITEYIYSIRNKFKKVDLNPIKTVWGIGYKWTLA